MEGRQINTKTYEHLMQTKIGNFKDMMELAEIQDGDLREVKTDSPICKEESNMRDAMEKVLRCGSSKDIAEAMFMCIKYLYSINEFAIQN